MHRPITDNAQYSEETTSMPVQDLNLQLQQASSSRPTV